MISTDFHQLVELFIEGSGNLQPSIFELDSFSESVFISAGFELIGDPNGFHSFEKAYDVPYFRRKITVVFKQYFFARESLGGGLGIAGGVRLTSLLRNSHLLHQWGMSIRIVWCSFSSRIKVMEH